MTSKSLGIYNAYTTADKVAGLQDSLQVGHIRLEARCSEKRWLDGVLCHLVQSHVASACAGRHRGDEPFPVPYVQHRRPLHHGDCLQTASKGLLDVES